MVEDKTAIRKSYFSSCSDHTSHFSKTYNHQVQAANSSPFFRNFLQSAMALLMQKLHQMVKACKRRSNQHWLPRATSFFSWVRWWLKLRHLWVALKLLKSFGLLTQSCLHTPFWLLPARCCWVPPPLHSRINQWDGRGMLNIKQPGQAIKSLMQRQPTIESLKVRFCI